MKFEEIKERLFLGTVGTERERELLKTVPHRDTIKLVPATNYYPGEGLSFILKVLISDSANRSGSMIVTNKNVAEMGIPEDELFTIARRNSETKRPMVILPMGEMFGGADISAYVITNENMYDGTAVIAYDGALKMISEKMKEVSPKSDGAFYILPSSKNEVIVVPAAPNVMPHEWLDIVQTVNTTVVEPETPELLLGNFVICCYGDEDDTCHKFE